MNPTFRDASSPRQVSHAEGSDPEAELELMVCEEQVGPTLARVSKEVEFVGCGQLWWAAVLHQA